MTHYVKRIANGGAYVIKKQRETTPVDNGVTFDPMKKLNGARNLRSHSGIRGNNAGK